MSLHAELHQKTALVPGYERFTGTDGLTFPPVPGVGPVLSVTRVGNEIHATRRDGEGEATYRASPTGWVKVE